MLTNDKITSIFYLIDDMLKESGHKKYSNFKMSDNEVSTTAFVSALYFKCYLENAMSFMKLAGMVPNMLDKSRFLRCIH